MGYFTLRINDLLALEAWDTTGGGGAPTPGKLDVPANLRQTNSTSTTNTLAWNTVAGADTYELRRGSQTVYSGPALTATDTGLGPLTGYGYTVRAVDSTEAKQPSDYSATVTATTTAATAPYTLVPTPNDFLGNAGMNELQSDGRYRHATFARLPLKTTASSLGVLTTASYPNGDARNSFSAFVSNTLLGPYTLLGTYTPAAGASTTPLTLPGSGERYLRLVEGSADQISPGLVWGTSITGLTFPASTTSQFVSVSFEEVVVGLGDSILSGTDAGIKQLYGWWPQIITDVRDATAISAGSRTGKDAWGDTDSRDLTLGYIDIAFSKPGVTSKALWVGLMVNDWAKQVWTPTEYGNKLAELIDLVHINHPTAIVYLQSAIPYGQAQGENTLYNGFFIQDFRNVMSALVTPARSSWAKLVDGLEFGRDAVLPDGLHPDKPTHAFMGQRANNVLLGQPMTGSPWDPTDQADWFTSLSGNTVAKTSGNDAWDGFRRGVQQINEPAASFNGVVWEALIPQLAGANGGCVVGLSLSKDPTAAGTDRRGRIFFGVYGDLGSGTVWRNGANGKAIPASADKPYKVTVTRSGGNDIATLSLDGTELDTLAVPGWPMHLHGVLYYPSPQGTNSRITNVQVSGSTLSNY
jgi:hypothetical protein